MGASQTGEPRENFCRRIAIRYSVVIVVLFAVLVLLQVWTGALELGRLRVGGVDPVDLYVYLPSLFFDGDLDFENEYQHFSPDFLRSGQRPKTATAHRPNPHGIGMAIAQSPFYAAAYVAVAVKKRCIPVSQEFKYMPLFEYAWYVGNVFWSAFATFLLAWWLRRDVGVKRALPVAVFFLLATPLLYYAFPLSPMSHQVSLASILLMLLCLGKWENTLNSRWCLAAGFSLGFAVSVHLFNAVYVLFAATYFLLGDRGKEGLASTFGTERVTRIMKPSGLLCVGAIIGFLPQIIVHRIVFGSIFLNPYRPDCATAQFSISLSNLQTAYKVAFSLAHGFITWHPILAIALAGVLWASLRGSAEKRLSISGLSAILGTWAILSGFVTWWAGWSFGHRLFISLYPFFALGIAALTDSLLECKRRWKVLVLWSLASIFVLWNVLFVIQYKLGIIPRGEAITFHEFLWQKLVLLRQLLTGRIVLPL